MKIPKNLQKKIADFKPQYNELSFESSEKFLEWLKETTEIEIFLEDSHQDLIKFNVAKSGEIIHAELPSMANLYNGSLLLYHIDLILPGDNIVLWIPQFNDINVIKYVVEKVIRK